MDVQVAIVEDDPRYRAGLEALFTYTEGFHVAAVFTSALEATTYAADRLASGKPLVWEVVLMDIEMPGMDGIEGTRRLKHAKPALDIIVLTVFEEPTVILDAIQAGADGYVLKKTPGSELIEHVRVVRNGGASLTPAIARSVLDVVRNPPSRPAPRPTRLDLTDREQDVLRGLVRGLAYKEIGDDLGISLDTVRSHIRRLYKKLQVQNAAAAVNRAVREGLV